MSLYGIALGGRKPRKVKEKLSDTNKNTDKSDSKQRADVIYLGKQHKEKKKRLTYLDEWLKCYTRYQQMSVMEQTEYRKTLIAENRQREITKQDGSKILKPVKDNGQVLKIHYKTMLHMKDVLTDRQMNAVLLLSCYIDKTDGSLRGSHNSLLSLMRLSEITGYSVLSVRNILYELHKRNVIVIDKITKVEFDDIWEQEAFAELPLCERVSQYEYRIYMNPFVVFVHQYIDLEVAKQFYGGEWGLYNNDYAKIKKWIEKNCE